MTTKKQTKNKQIKNIMIPIFTSTLCAGGGIGIGYAIWASNNKETPIPPLPEEKISFMCWETSQEMQTKYGNNYTFDNDQPSGTTKDSVVLTLTFASKDTPLGDLFQDGKYLIGFKSDNDDLKGIFDTCFNKSTDVKEDGGHITNFTFNFKSGQTTSELDGEFSFKIFIFDTDNNKIVYENEQNFIFNVYY